MMTNAGTKVLTTEADILNFGKAMVDKTQSANVLGFSHLVENFKVTYDSEVEDAFVVHTKWGPIKFVNKEGLYIYKPSKSITNSSKTSRRRKQLPLKRKKMNTQIKQSIRVMWSLQEWRHQIFNKTTIP